MILPRDFYGRDTVEVAQDLLGCCLVHPEGRKTTAGIIVETEAYLSGDPAAHSYIGRTNRNEVLFGPVGHAYVYLIYGMHYCINVVTGEEGSGEAVLVRALEPVIGIPVMIGRRGTPTLSRLCSGPGKLTRAMGITRECNGVSFVNGPLQIRTRENTTGPNPALKPEIVRTTRIGIVKAADKPLRFYLKGNPNISRK
ncbi:DNA-3-methyladenine glycosylase [Methanolinea mesophila]|uniref:DNA-3-methyladenine glycosylase n=1 Tax=Methanolinea mesophila TaxID=547055 RepID=UPI001AE1619B|nr:DNA-3-methyladenine glycosylase [Methanolinea mesophila]MBP1929758.1 DNA-3-methyladenine glycosylase [Methanolinea mesophila]